MLVNSIVTLSGYAVELLLNSLWAFVKWKCDPSNPGHPIDRTSVSTCRTDECFSSMDNPVNDVPYGCSRETLSSLPPNHPEPYICLTRPIISPCAVRSTAIRLMDYCSCSDMGTTLLLNGSLDHNLREPCKNSCQWKSFPRC